MSSPVFDVEGFAHRITGANDMEQSSVVGEAFDAWYEVARAYARGDLAGGEDAMSSASGRAFLFFAGHYMSSGALHHATETFTAAVLHSNLRKLCRVFKTKERFSALVDGRRHPALFEIITARVPELLERMLAARGGDDASAEAMRSLRSWSETMLALREGREDASLEPTFTLRTLVNAIVHSSEHSILRTEAVLTAQVVGAACPSMRAPLVSAIVESATDEEALAPAWQLGVLDDPRCLERLMTRIRDAPRRNMRSTLPSAVLCESLLPPSRPRDPAPSPPPLARWPSNSLYSALVNERHKQVDRARPDVSQSTDERKAERGEGGGDADGEAPAGAAARPGLPGLDPARHAAVLCKIVRSCEGAMAEVDAAAQGGSLREGDRPDEALQVAGALLEAVPGDESALDLALRPATLSGVAHVAGMGGLFPEAVWTSYLLPFLRDQLNEMSTSGVSGEQLEQEVVSLVRECARVFYLAAERAPSVALGAALFAAICDAIRHGYIETERFPQIAATVAAQHMPAASTRVPPEEDPKTWLVRELSDEMPLHRTVRALADTTTQLLGLTTTATGGELGAEALLSDAQCDALLLALAEQPTRATVALWLDLVVNHTAWTAPREEPLRRLVQACSVVADAARARLSRAPLPPHARGAPLPPQDRDLVPYLTSVADLLRALASRCPSAVAEPLLDALTNLMDAHPTAAVGYRDEALCAALAKLPADAEIAPRAVAYISGEAGIAPRSQLARARPEIGLCDRTSDVRLAAMQALAQRPARAGELAQLVLTAWIPGRADLGAEEQQSVSHAVGDSDAEFALRLDEVECEIAMANENASLGLSEAALAEAAAPLLAHIATRRPTLLAACLSRLALAAEISVENDPQNLPSATVRSALATVASQTPPRSLTAFCLSREGRALLPALCGTSVEWEQLTQRLVAGGFLRQRCLVKGLKPGKAPVRPGKLPSGGGGAGASAAFAPAVPGAGGPAAAAVASAERRNLGGRTLERHPTPSAPPVASGAASPATPATPSRARLPRVWIALRLRGRDRGAEYEVGDAAAALLAAEGGAEVDAFRPMAGARGRNFVHDVPRSSVLPTDSSADLDARLDGHAYLRLADRAESKSRERAPRPRAESAVMAEAAAVLAGEETVDAQVDAVCRAAAGGKWMEAIRLLCGVMNRYPRESMERGLGDYLRGTLLPGLRDSLLPGRGATASEALAASGPAFSRDQMARVELAEEALREAQSLCPREAEEVLEASARLRELHGAIVRQVLAVGGTTAARTWMEERGLHDAALAEVIDRWEFTGQRTPQTVAGGAQSTSWADALPAAPRHKVDARQGAGEAAAARGPIAHAST